MLYHLEGLCPKCGSTSLLVLASNPGGRHCDACGAGIFILREQDYEKPKPIPREMTHKEALATLAILPPTGTSEAFPTAVTSSHPQ